jgi:anti-sigma B factor antagonist
MSFESWHEHGAVVVGVDGPLDVRTRQELMDLILGALERGEQRFRLDFSRTGFVDSAGLGVLVSLHKRVGDRGGSLALTGLNDEFRNLLALTRLDTLLRIADGGDGTADVPARVPPRSPSPLTGGNEIDPRVDGPHP